MRQLIISVLLSIMASQAFCLKALVLADIHYVPGQASTSYAENGSASDTGADLLQSLAHEVKAVNKLESPDVTLILGDLPGHGLSNRMHVDQAVLDELHPSLAKMPVFYLVGNNDTFGGNYHSFSQLDLATGDVYSPLQLFDGMIPGWNIQSTCSRSSGQACFIDNGSYQGHPFYFGYYSAYMGKDRSHRLIALNSMIFLTDKYWVPYVSDDGVNQEQAAQLQLAWFENQLKQAKAKGESIVLMTHIPSGINSYSGDLYWKAPYQKAFQQLMHQYGGEIAVMLTGHTHMNELHFYRRDGVAQVISIGVPGMTPSHGNDPGFNLMVLNQAGIDARNSISYRYDPNLGSWQVYTDFVLCESKESALLKLVKSCGRAVISDWSWKHFTNGNTQFVPAQGKKSVEQAIGIN